MLSSSDVEILSWMWAAQPIPGSQRVRTDDVWSERYRADMAVAVRVCEAVAARCVDVEWRPIVDAHAPTTRCYREGVARITRDCEQAAAITSGVFMPCLERLGLARAFDRAIARHIVDDLRRWPDACVAFNISAQSATLDSWWASMVKSLKANSALAYRLVVEITGDTALPDPENAREFCAQLQQLGVRIAIDDFGASGISSARAAKCRPDIVKLAPCFIRDARDSEEGFDTLRDLLRQCRTVAPVVVVDGIEGECDLRIGLRAGSRWLQGYYFGGPRVPARRPPKPRRDEKASAVALAFSR